MNVITKEQEEIVNSIRDNNVIVDCVVGSGKTTTILFIAEKYKNKKILLLTYNKKLRHETLERVYKRNLENIDVHTFHSYYVNNHCSTCFNDIALYNYINNSGNYINEQFIKNNENNNEKRTLYDIIIVDEAQDLNNIYYKAIMYILNHNKPEYNLCIIGDKKQSIYDYNGSDARYMIYADKLFKTEHNFKPWIRRELSKTFRCNSYVCDFIRNCLNGPEIKTDKYNNKKIRYIFCNQFSGRPYREVLYYKNELKINVSDIIVLAPSVKNPNTPIRTIANKLSEQNIPVYCALSDNEKLDSDILNNKIVFCTYHQAKGLERKAVIVLNFDNSYTTYYNKHANMSDELNNELYVALTRSSEYLSLVHHNKNNFLPFMNSTRLQDYCTIEGSLDIKQKTTEKQERSYSVSDLIRHLSHDTILEIKNIIDDSITLINNPEEKIDIRCKVKQNNNSYENVSDITGVAIPSYYEYKKTGYMTILENLLNNNSKDKIINKIKNKKTNFVESSELCFREDCDLENEKENKKTNEENFSLLNYDNITPQKLLFISNKWLCTNNGFLFKINQIDNYNWLNNNILDKCYFRIDKWLVEKDILFEIPYNKIIERNHCTYIINGIIDCISNNNVFEFKCVDTLDYVHFIQLILYKFLVWDSNNNDDNSNFNYYLLNILDNSCYKVCPSIEQCNEIVNILLDKKIKENSKISDEDFLNDNLI